MDLCLSSHHGSTILSASLLLAFLGAAAWFLAWRWPRYRTMYIAAVGLLSGGLVASLIPWGFPGPFRAECASAWREAGSVAMLALVITILVGIGTRGPRSRPAG